MSRFEREGACAATAPATRCVAVAIIAAAAASSSPAARSATRRPRSTPGSAATWSRRSASRPSGSPTGCRSTSAQTSSPAASRPTTSSAAAASTTPRRRRAATSVAGAAGHRRTPSTRPRSVPRPPPKQELETLLVTGDSLSTPLDPELARRLAPDGVEVIRDPHLATGISNSDLADWGELSTAPGRASTIPTRWSSSSAPTRASRCPGPDGAEVECCGPEYAAVYANRVRQVMDTYRQDGDGEGLLADGDDAARPGRGAVIADWSTRRSRSPPSRGAARCG